jgi:O-antigen ligase
VHGPATLERGFATDAVDAPTRSELVALHVLQFGAVAIVLAAVTWKVFELDRFFVPKELALHLTAFTAGLFALGALRRAGLGRIDLLLGAYLLLGIVSGVLATNPWLAARALAITASGLVIFWTARALRVAGLDFPLLAALAFAVVLGAATALAQAYGVSTDFFSLNRAPGGTLGNRNFIAHLAAVGLPIVLLVALRARGVPAYLLAATGAVIIVAALILTRSRAGWLAFAAVMVCFGFAMLAAPALRRHGRTWLRLAVIVILAGAGVAAALTLPNELRWRSDSPYLDTVRGVANYQEGSGRGRLIQYRQSMRLAADNPVLGVGPGNWAVAYPERAAPGDPSLDGSAAGMTSNPWPSSDWTAFVSERGAPAALLLALALLAMALTALRRLLRSADADEALNAAALTAIIAAAAVAGAFDAVLLLALPTFVVWAALGALWPPAAARSASAAHGAGPAAPAAPRAAAGAAYTVLFVLVIAMAAAGTVRSGGQLAAMGIYAEKPELLRYAALFDPGNYRVRLRLAREGERGQRCRHAQAAHALFPSAAAARTLSRRCGS